jgi:hypothetical protein
MTIAMARLVVKTEINRLARLEPDEARDLERAIHVLIDDAVAREIRRIGIDVLGEYESRLARSDPEPEEGG